MNNITSTVHKDTEGNIHIKFNN